MKKLEKIKKILKKKKYTWLITGVAGFIGSNLLERLLHLDQKVIGVDNLASGSRKNLADVKKNLSNKKWKNFNFLKGDITKINFCLLLPKKIDFVLHHAALGSVPKSIDNPILANNNNISGFLNILTASRLRNVKSFVYASSSAVYGDNMKFTKSENDISNLLSPYALTKYTNELYASIFFKCYNFSTIGLRYFNVFGNRQDPKGDYAAVIPKWINQILYKKNVIIYGDGKTSRDFISIENVVNANLLATFANQEARNQVYNIGSGNGTSLNKLFKIISTIITSSSIQSTKIKNPVLKKFRKGDIKHSTANIQKSKTLLGYHPCESLDESLEKTIKIILNKKNIK
jgi:UDP-N-acetylglucosamine 4-epimerase